MENKKGEKVVSLFNSIAPRYDLVNFITSWGNDGRWRKKGVELFLEELKKREGLRGKNWEKGERIGRMEGVEPPLSPFRVVDVATGTGKMVKTLCQIGKKRGIKLEILGVDPSPQMLEIAQKECPFATFQLGKGEQLPFPDNFADGVTIAFGLRNFENFPQGVEEIYRILKPGGLLLVLEFVAGKGIFRKVVDWYTSTLVPLIGGLLTGNREAYSYLSSSISHFYTPDQLLSLFSSSNFTPLHTLTFNAGQLLVAVLKKK
jgi:demethylmenaquinone methyltransferase/2-methoxy-6-polyprenyl-1,4-benzoquinol methylase